MPDASPPGSRHCAIHAELPTPEEGVSGHPPSLLRAPATRLHVGVFHEHPVCSWVIKCDTKWSKSSTTEPTHTMNADWFRASRQYNVEVRLKWRATHCRAGSSDKQRQTGDEH